MGLNNLMYKHLCIVAFMLTLQLFSLPKSIAQSLLPENGIYQKVFTDRSSEHFYKLTDSDKEYLEQFRDQYEGKLVNLGENRLIYLLSIKEIVSANLSQSDVPSVIYVIEESEFWKYTNENSVQSLYRKETQAINNVSNE